MSDKYIKMIRKWIEGLIVQAIESSTREEDREEILLWLAGVRQILADETLANLQKLKNITGLVRSSKVLDLILNSVKTSFENYKSSDLPLPAKVAIPVTVGAIGLFGGGGAGIALLGGAFGVPVVLLIFLGSAGITSILEVILKNPAARGEIAVILEIIARDEMFRRLKKEFSKSIQQEMATPRKVVMPEDESRIKETLLSMNAFDFEKHVMGFFAQTGFLTMVTRKSNDFGIDGWCRHPDGLIVVQCKKNSPENPVGRPTVQQFRGAIEEQGALTGYIVTTSRFTQEAKDSASLHKIKLIDMDELLRWHLGGFDLSV